MDFLISDDDSHPQRNTDPSKIIYAYSVELMALSFMTVPSDLQDIW